MPSQAIKFVSEICKDSANEEPFLYDDDDHTVDVYSIRNTTNNDRSRIKYFIDEFGNVKQKDIYTGESSVNSYKYKFNYLNNPAVNFDALNDSTNMTYDGLNRLVQTRNPDASFVKNSYSFMANFSNYFGSVAGVVMFQRFTDEEGNYFDKYTDAVGNLRREVKFIQEDPNVEIIEELKTDYKYDSLYRVTQVRTPNGKDIYYSYDGYGRQSKRTTPDAGQTDYIYDDNNNLTYSQDANQRNDDATKYSFRNYDGLNRLTGIGERKFGIDAPSDGRQNLEDVADNYFVINVYDTITTSIVPELFTVPPGYSSPLYTKGQLTATAYRTESNENWGFKYYRYDQRGRVVKMWNVIADFNTLITEYFYNSQDQLTTYSHSGLGKTKTFRNNYDHAGRLYKVEYYVGDPDASNPNYVTFIEYNYNENSQLREQVMFEGVKNQYYYNNRNWIIEFLNTDGIFGYSNGYFKNGNVKSQNLTGSYTDNFSRNDEIGFNYSYDKSNRLLSSIFISQQAKDDYKLTNTYDKDGNILTLKRYDSDANLTDNFSYAYYSGTNKLQRVTGAGTQYNYDYNGNVTSESINNNSEIKYDHRNLITQLKHRSHIITDSSYYVSYYKYDEAGNRIAKITYKYIGTVGDPEVPSGNDINSDDSWELVSDIIYSRDVSGREIAIYDNPDLVQWNVYGLDNIGKINSNDSKYYYLKDHLGSIRAEVDENGVVVSSQDYDAWGYLLEGRKYQSDASMYKFTGKERDEESEYDYSYARNYNSRIGIFNSSEPIPSSSFGWSSYVYCANNPLRIIDPSGEEWYYIYDEPGKGNWQFYKDKAEMDVWTGKYDEGGNKIMEKKQGHKELLFFQGSELQWLMESGERMKWIAVSGIVDMNGKTQPNLSNVSSVGPIPEGWWTVDPINAYSMNEAIYPWDIANWIRKYAAQGEAYINIYPAPDNPSERISGFSIHGGLIPGSIGCIDLMMGVGNFYNKFINHNKSMLLNVNYSNFK